MSPSDRLPALPVRFFYQTYTCDLVEIPESTFWELLCQGHGIDYVRHTTRDNGVDEICLTIGN